MGLANGKISLVLKILCKQNIRTGRVKKRLNLTYEKIIIFKKEKRKKLIFLMQDQLGDF